MRFLALVAALFVAGCEFEEPKEICTSSHVETTFWPEYNMLLKMVTVQPHYTTICDAWAPNPKYKPKPQIPQSE